MMRRVIPIALIGAGIVTTVSYGKLYIDVKKFEQEFAKNKQERK
jgi:hypothetical protein